LQLCVISAKILFMHKRMTFTVGFVLAVAALPAIGQQRSAAPVSIVASVGHSEWCWPPGTVRLNLATGRYAVTPSPRWRTCRRPVWPRRVRTGILAGGDLAAVRAAYGQARAEGLEDPACRHGGHPPRVVISNGGDRILRLVVRRVSIVPPHDEGCWSDGASRLHRLLNDLFRPDAAR
jgi:hypothetical protein